LLELKDNLESATSDGSPDKLVAIPKRLVATHFMIGKETLHCLVEGDMMGREFIAFEVVLKVGWGRTRSILPSVIHSQHRQKRFLRDLHASHFLHTFLAFLLLLEQFAFA